MQNSFYKFLVKLLALKSTLLTYIEVIFY